MNGVIIETFRDAYGTDQIDKTLTVRELINLLEEYEEDRPVYLSFDRGYTYGAITGDRITEE